MLVLLFLGWQSAIPTDCRAIAARVLDAHKKFRDVIATDDLVRLDACMESSQPAFDLEALLERGQYQEMAVSTCVAEAYLARDQREALRDVCDADDPQCAPTLAVKKRHKLPKTQCPAQKALPGGILFGLLLGHVRTKGHYDITRDARPAGFSPERWELAADAAQDPDFYEFNHPAAHAQARNDDAHAFLLTEDGKRAFVAWEHDKLERSLASCAADKGGDALYWLGYSIHAVQDLVFHEGISNAEHSFLDYNHSVGVDWKENFPAKLKTATDLSKHYLAAVHEWMGARDGKCWERMTGAGKRAAKRDLVGHWDFGFSTWKSYKGLGKIVATAMAPCSSRPGPHCDDPPRYFLSVIPNRLVPFTSLTEHRWLGGDADEKAGDAFVEQILGHQPSSAPK